MEMVVIGEWLSGWSGVEVDGGQDLGDSKQEGAGVVG